MRCGGLTCPDLVLPLPQLSVHLANLDVDDGEHRGVQGTLNIEYLKVTKLSSIICIKPFFSWVRVCCEVIDSLVVLK